jgi:hypothetical protein
MSAPVFIIGTERSGSNMLRLMLDAHSRVFMPHPPHVMHYFAHLEPHYGDLAREVPFRRLVRDVLRLVHRHIHPWEHVPSEEEVIASSPSRDLLGVKVGLYEAARRRSGKARWGSKSTFVVHHGERVLQVFPRARMLWLVRDPRDVAVSSRRSVFSPFHPLHVAELWAEQQALAGALEQRHPGAVLRVHYEELVREPDAQIVRILAFLGEEMEPAVSRFYERAAAKHQAALSESWANTARPARPDSVGAWRHALLPREVAVVEAVAGPAMAELGYRPSLPRRTEVGALERWAFRLSGWRDQLKVEARSLLHDQNVWRRWGRALLLRRIELEVLAPIPVASR